MKMYYLHKRKLIPILIIIFGIYFISCNSLKNKYSYKMEISNITQPKNFDIESYTSNSGTGNVYEFVREDGTKVKQSSFPGGYAEIETPLVPAFYKIEKLYYQNGKIQEFGAALGFMKIGVWKYYDENGKETVVDEDEKYGKPNYNDVLAFLDKKGYINLHTGENRERVSVGYDPKARMWGAVVFNFKGKNHIYDFDRKGKVISYKTIIPTE